MTKASSALVYVHRKVIWLCLSYISTGLQLIWSQAVPHIIHWLDAFRLTHIVTSVLIKCGAMLWEHFKPKPEMIHRWKHYKRMCTRPRCINRFVTVNSCSAVQRILHTNERATQYQHCKYSVQFMDVNIWHMGTADKTTDPCP